mgnify:CR=1 FL=1
MRSLAWFSVFAAAVIAPLGLAIAARGAQWSSPTVAFGAACGWLAFALLAAEFGLVTRVRAAAAAFGSDALLLFHRAMAFVALALIAAHVVALAPRWPNPFAGSGVERWGSLALCALLALIAVSLWRRQLRCAYELWLVSHRALAATIVLASLAHVWPPLARTPHLRSWVAGGCVGLALAALAWQRLVRPALLARRLWEVVENRDEGASTRTLVLRAIGHGGLRFAPGQFVWLRTRRSGAFAQEHPISIASSAELDGGRTLELAIKALGDWSRELVPQIPAGERVRIDGPFGAFTPDGLPAERLVLIAGGIGITPMRSILLTMRDRGDRRPVTLLYAADRRARAAFADELESLRGALALELVFVFEHPDPGEACEVGLLSAELLRRHLPHDLRFTQFFVCGPTPMMDAVERFAVQLGIPSRQLHTERFDMV